MIRKPDLLAKFEIDLAARQMPDYVYGLKIFEGLYCEALALGVLPLPNPLEGIETIVSLTRDLNHVPRPNH